MAEAGKALSVTVASGAFLININTDNVQVARDVCKTITEVAESTRHVARYAGITAVSLSALYLGYKLVRSLIETAVTRGLGGERDDQEVRDIRTGSLHVLLHCFTDERFLEVLADYESGRMKERLQEEFSRIGIKVEGLKVEIENMAEVNETKEAINKRSHINKDLCEDVKNIVVNDTESDLGINVQEHYQDCLVTCPNEGCNVKMLKRNLGGHMTEECQFKKEQKSIVEVSGPQVARIDEEVTMSETTSYDGTFIWKIEHFGRQSEDAVAGRCLSINSPYFYVGRNGYKVCARVYLNGDGMGKGTHLSLFLVVMLGDYDALLPWPFQQKVSFKLINQTGNQHMIESFRPDPNSPSFQRPQSKMNVASGCPLFVPKYMLHGAGYIKDETVYIKITVDTIGLPIY